jgi:hypothetical protein
LYKIVNILSLIVAQIKSISPRKNMTKIIALSGGIGCGKTHLTKEFIWPILSKQKPTLILSFADHFKISVCSQQNVQYERVFIKKDEQSRRLLQSHGNYGRSTFGKDIWIKHIANWIRMHSENGIEQFIIPDVRMPEELNWLKHEMKATCIRVHAPKRNWDKALQEANGDEWTAKALLSDTSETALNDQEHSFDYILKNDHEDADTVPHEIHRILKVFTQSD